MKSVDAVKILKTIINEQGKTITSVAKKLNKTPQALSSQFQKNNLKLNSFLDIAAALCCDVTIIITDRANGKEYILDGKKDK